MSVSKRTRFEVFKRDGFRCIYCGRTPPQAILEIDHVIPRSKGGPDDMVNLATSCFDCNRGKSDVSLTSVSPQLAEVMDRAIERRDQVEAYNQFLLDARAAVEKQIHQLGLRWFDALRRPRQRRRFVFGEGRARSVREFLKKLTEAEIVDAMEIAQGRIAATSMENEEKRWKYFCGVCWNKIRDRDDTKK